MEATLQVDSTAMGSMPVNNAVRQKYLTENAKFIKTRLTISKRRAMSKICDLHVHSNLSADSSASLAIMCQSAIAKGIACIAFTEHCDLNPHDEDYAFFNPERFSNEIEQVREKFANQLTILKGIEFGEPHLYPDGFAALRDQDYDIILGSIHMVGDVFVGSREKILSQYTIEQLYNQYYTIMLWSAQFGGFDALAHFDFPKRYYQETVTDLPIIEDILTLLVQSEIALEINTSSLRKGLVEPMPSVEILRKYAALGGRRITLGSDAHKPEHIGADFEYIQELLHEFPQFEVGYFDQRRFVSTMSKP
jgi:histidinol-phosphatase (PHP family)